MSVLIKGMEMPKTGEYRCVIRKWQQGDTLTIDLYGEEELSGTIVPIPPHGRLIDADALEVQDGWLRDSKYFAQESSHTHITFVYSEDIYNAPTVIPADK